MNAEAKPYVPLRRALPTMVFPMLTMMAVAVIVLFAHRGHLGSHEARGAFAGIVQFLAGYVAGRWQQRLAGDRYRNGATPLSLGAINGGAGWVIATFVL